MGDQTTKLCDFTNAPNAQFIASPITSPKIKANSFEVSPGLLNLIAKDQFGGSASEDASMHLHDFCEIFDMQKFENVENHIVKLKLLPFSLRGKLKIGYFHYLMVALIHGIILEKLSSRNTILRLKFCKTEIASFLISKMITNM
jgi:hypothetical protein